MHSTNQTPAPPWLADFLRLHPSLIRLASSLVGRDSAEDVVQTAFLRAREKAPNSSSAFPAWMSRVVVTTALNYIQRQRFPIPISALNGEGSSNRRWENQVKASSQTSLWKRLARKEMSQMVKNTMDRLLTEEERKVIALKINGSTHPEIADLLGLPLKTVKFMLHYALMILRDEMAKRGASPVH